MHVGVFDLCERLRIAMFTGTHSKHMTSWQHLNAGPPGERLRNVAPQIKPGQCGGVATGIDRRAPRQRTGLRSKPERAGGFCQVKGLDSIGIADQPQLLFDTIPQRRSVHPTEFTEAWFAPVSDDIDQYFGIAIGFEYATQALEFFTQGTVIVNLAVEADDPAAG